MTNPFEKRPVESDVYLSQETASSDTWFEHGACAHKFTDRTNHAVRSAEHLKRESLLQSIPLIGRSSNPSSRRSPEIGSWPTPSSMDPPARVLSSQVLEPTPAPERAHVLE